MLVSMEISIAPATPQMLVSMEISIALVTTTQANSQMLVFSVCSGHTKKTKHFMKVYKHFNIVQFYQKYK